MTDEKEMTLKERVEYLEKSFYKHTQNIYERLDELAQFASNIKDKFCEHEGAHPNIYNDGMGNCYYDCKKWKNNLLKMKELIMPMSDDIVKEFENRVKISKEISNNEIKEIKNDILELRKDIDKMKSSILDRSNNNPRPEDNCYHDFIIVSWDSSINYSGLKVDIVCRRCNCFYGNIRWDK